MTHRRDFVKMSSAAALAFGAGLATTNSQSASAAMDDKKNLSAEEVLQELIRGNKRFVAGKSRHPRRSEDWLRSLTKGQRPVATILSCSDSRVPLELLFDVGFGDLFVIRVAGNVVTRYGIGSMEYAQHHLHTPLYIILGHEGCGAVTAAMLPKTKRDREPKGVRELLDLIHVGKVDPLADKSSQVAAAVEANVRHSTKQLMELDEEDEGFHVRKDELVVSAVYELSTGQFRILDRH